MSRVICDPALHPYLKAHPEDLLNLKPFPLVRGDQGECPGCLTSLIVPWSEERRRAEGVPSIAQDAAADQEAA